MSNHPGLAVFALLAAGCASQPPVDPPAAEPQPDTAAVAEEIAAAPELPAPLQPAAGPDRSNYRISIASVGDMMLGTDYPENHLPDDDGVSFL